jgi:hypothetical protein
MKALRRSLENQLAFLVDTDELIAKLAGRNA